MTAGLGRDWNPAEAVRPLSIRQLEIRRLIPSSAFLPTMGARCIHFSSRPTTLSDLAVGVPSAVR
jgi:hypothetical protein